MFIFLRVESWPMRTAHQGVDEVERVARGVRDTFLKLGGLQPRITVNNRVYIEESLPVAELTVLTRQIEVEHEMEHTWAGSTKRVKLHGTFVARAGFDLRQEVSVTSNANETIVRLPHATVLGVDEKKIDVLEFEHGYWNRISRDDVANELGSVAELAREKVAQSDLPAQAERTLEKQLTDRIKPDKTLRVLFVPPAPHG